MEVKFIPIYNDHINKNMKNSFSEIYTSCLINKKSKDCNFVLKQMHFNLRDKYGNLYSKKKLNRKRIEINDFYNEITNQSIASKFYLTSPIYKYYIEKEHCGFIMEKYHKTLLDLLKENIPLNEKYKLLDKAFHLLEKLHYYCDIIHKDAHLTNFMMNDKNELKLIDFGLSKLHPNIEEKYNDFQIFIKNFKEQYFEKDNNELIQYWTQKMIHCNTYHNYLLTYN